MEKALENMKKEDNDIFELFYYAGKNKKKLPNN